MKKSKEAYYNKHFETNWRNIKNLWKGIKSQISLKTVFSSVPIVFSLGNGDPITNPYDIANTFNNYFASIAETMKKTICIYIYIYIYIYISDKHCSDYLRNKNGSTIFLQPTDKKE